MGRRGLALRLPGVAWQDESRSWTPTFKSRSGSSDRIGTALPGVAVMSLAMSTRILGAGLAAVLLSVSALADPPAAATKKASPIARHVMADWGAIRRNRLEQNAAIAKGDIDAIAAFWTDDVTICRGLAERRPTGSSSRTTKLRPGKLFTSGCRRRSRQARSGHWRSNRVSGRVTLVRRRGRSSSRDSTRRNG
jgi:hypothetical protein